MIVAAGERHAATLGPAWPVWLLLQRTRGRERGESRENSGSPFGESGEKWESRETGPRHLFPLATCVLRLNAVQALPFRRSAIPTHMYYVVDLKSPESALPRAARGFRVGHFLSSSIFRFCLLSAVFFLALNRAVGHELSLTSSCVGAFAYFSSAFFFPSSLQCSSAYLSLLWVPARLVKANLFWAPRKKLFATLGEHTEAGMLRVANDVLLSSLHCVVRPLIRSIVFSHYSSID